MCLEHTYTRTHRAFANRAILCNTLFPTQSIFKTRADYLFVKRKHYIQYICIMNSCLSIHVTRVQFSFFFLSLLLFRFRRSFFFSSSSFGLLRAIPISYVSIERTKNSFPQQDSHQLENVEFGEMQNGSFVDLHSSFN